MINPPKRMIIGHLICSDVLHVYGEKAMEMYIYLKLV